MSTRTSSGLSSWWRTAAALSLLTAPSAAWSQPADPPAMAQPPATAPAAQVPTGPVSAPMVAPAPALAATPTPQNVTAVAPGAVSITIRDIDREVTALSNDIGTTYARMQQITAMVLDSAGGGGAQLIIQHQNEMGSTFRLVRATYSLDGATIATRVDDNGSLAELHDFAVFNGRVSSGDHTVTVSLEYQGNGNGIFSYIRGYTFRARSVQTVSAPEGRALRLTVIGYEQGGAATAVEDRPAIRYAQSVTTVAEARAQNQRNDSAPAPAAGSEP